MSYRIPDSLIAEANAKRAAALEDDYGALGRQLARRGLDIEAITAKAAAFGVAVPTWGVGTGGTRFARFPGPGEPRDVFDKLEDCATIQQLTRATPTCSPHFPWDKVSDYRALAELAKALGLGFDAVNSNTFQDQPGQKLSYKFGSLTHASKAVRDQAVAHNLECIEIGEKLGSKALTVWIADGSNFPGQSNLDRAFDRYLESLAEIYARLPGDWRVFLEHKLYEPAFYSTVISDWGTSLMAAQALGPKAHCLVDLGHHAPNVNIEQIVARLIRFGSLAGFHFNDSKYGDDDLDAGSIDPFRLFLRVQRAGRRGRAQGAGLRPGLHARPVAQRHRPDREPDGLGGRDAARLRAGARRRPRGAGGGARRKRRCSPHRLLKPASSPTSRRSSPRRGVARAAPSIPSPRIAPRATAPKKPRSGRPSRGRRQASCDVSTAGSISELGRRRRHDHIAPLGMLFHFADHVGTDRDDLEIGRARVGDQALDQSSRDARPAAG